MEVATYGHQTTGAGFQSGSNILDGVVGQVIDALAFGGTQDIDTDFRANTTATIRNIAVLQQEQAFRLNQRFGPVVPRSDAVAAELEGIYTQADAAELLSDRNPKAIARMDESAAKAFKKELKMRIHAWEGAFREQHGSEPAAADKAKLRRVYELYKAVKARVTTTTPPTGPQSAPSVASPSSTLNQGPSASVTSTQRTEGSRPVSQTTQSTAAASASGSVGPRAGGGGGSTEARQPQADMRAELQAEKRALKRELHQFEDEFRAQHGRVPTKEDRRLRQEQYHRYGELKAMLGSINA